MTPEQKQTAALIIEAVDELLKDSRFVNMLGDKRLRKVEAIRNLTQRLVPELRTFEDVKAMLEKLTIGEALWWFVENVAEDHPQRSSLFFYLRSRRAVEASAEDGRKHWRQAQKGEQA